MCAEGGYIYTFSTKARGRLTNESYSDPPHKDDSIWRSNRHPELRLIIHHHLTRAGKHLFASKKTYGTLAATYKAGFGKDTRRVSKISYFFSCKKKNEK